MDGSELLLSLAMDAAATRDISDKHAQHEPWLNIHGVSAQDSIISDKLLDRTER